MLVRKTTLAMLPMLGVLGFGAVHAAEDQIDEITVLGRYLSLEEANSVKTPTPVIDVPQSLSIFTADQINEQGITAIGEIIDYTAGVNTSQGEGHRDAVVFRGVRSTADFYIDGNRDDVQYYRGLYNVEQVEILRGPNALLFGRGGTGGVLNRVSKKAQLGEQFTGFRAIANSFGGFGTEVDFNTALSDTAALRVNGMYESLENHRDFFDGDRVAVNPTVRFALSEDTTLDLSYEYIDFERFIDRGIPTGADGRPVEAFEDIVFGNPEINETTLRADTFRAALSHRISDNQKVNLSAFYGDYDKVYQNFYASKYDQAESPDVVGLDGYIDETQRENLILSGNFVSEHTTGNINHTLLIGAEYIDTESDQFRFNPVFSTNDDDVEFFSVARPINFSGNTGVLANGQPTSFAFSDLNDDTRVDLDVTSFYIQNQFEISEKFDIVLGARYDEFDIEVFNAKNGENRSRKDDEVSPRAGLIYKPQENMSIYFSYSESFLPRSGEQFANINGDNNVLDPDEFTNLELGLKWDISPAMSFTAALFENEQTRPVVSDADASTFDILESDVSGVELQFVGQVTDIWNINASYTYLDGEQANSDLDPRELPENMFSMWNRFAVAENYGFGLGVIYQDESFINNSNSAVLPSYTRFDASAYYNVSEKLTVQLFVENLTDELYFPNSHSTHQATVGESINARLSLTGRF